jgi:hypothetical protein
MRRSLIVSLIVLLVVSPPASACKMLAKYPEHLSGNEPGCAQYYRVVLITGATPEQIDAVIVHHFGDSTDVGKKVELRFIPDEEAHAVCPISLETGKTYLIRSAGATPPMLVSRFNWLNVPGDHPNFGGYLQDLRRASTP